MKRRELIKHLGKEGCGLLREGSKHSVYVNRARLRVSTIPRHNEIDDSLARKICRDLEISLPHSLD